MRGSKRQHPQTPLSSEPDPSRLSTLRNRSRLGGSSECGLGRGGGILDTESEVQIEMGDGQGRGRGRGRGRGQQSIENELEPIQENVAHNQTEFNDAVVQQAEEITSVPREEALNIE